ncbi:MAG: HAD family hydrolase [Methanobacteriales archaeon]|uniref:HAD family hydrolase n=1 Tax=Methanothermobacter tenebrarum TaxID=680118 RepID=A0A328PJF0_9EURY|nr:HAD family hydrolase [Methanobacteriales archaeon]NPV64190.1 HAD family hydrolase [Methanobacteriaceae archaeon]RAO79975.1 HAD family hydrolase [Methanothermobacter tenebrarum]
MLVVLFDIDKTLLIGSHCHFYSFKQAFKDLYGENITLDIPNLQGMTDKQIIYQIAKKNGIRISDFENIRERIVDHYIKNVKREKIKPLRGTREILDLLEDMRIPKGIVTGNIEDIAWIKLKKARFNDYFGFGAFGDEGCQRSALLRLALKRAEKIYNKINPKESIIVGDTPRDIKAGKKVGTITVGVATGDFTIKELKAAGADHVFKSLEDKEKFIRIIQKNMITCEYS